MRARYVVRITPADVGQRVSVRYWRDGAAERGPGEPALTDALGELEAGEDGWLSIRQRDGHLVTVDEQTLVAGKTVPPAPPRPDRRNSY